MSKTRKKKKFQKRRKSRDAGSVSKVSEAVNKRDEKNFFKIAIIVTVVLIAAIYFFVIRTS